MSYVSDYDSHIVRPRDLDLDTSVDQGAAAVSLSAGETPRFRLDRRGRFTFVNRSAAQALRTKSDRAVGLLVSEVAEPVFGAGFKTKIMSALRKQQTLQFEHCCATKAPIWLALRCAPAAGGLDVFFLDITRWKNREQYWAKLNGDFLEARDEARRKAAHELHDIIAQDLVVALFNLEYLQGKRARAAQGDTAKVFAELKTVLDHCLSKVKALSSRLHPPLLEEAGILAALRWFIRQFQDQTGIKVTFTSPRKAQPLPAFLQQTIFRTVEEALWYYARHSKTRRAKIALSLTRSRAVLEIKDIDHGLASTGSDYLDEIASYGFGFKEIWARACYLRGRLRVTSTDNGNCISLILPLPHAQTTAAAGD